MNKMPTNKKPIYFITALALAVIAVSGIYVEMVSGATNINQSATERYSWNDIFGWANYYSENTVTVTSQKVEGYASSSAGEISLDCATTSGGDICSQSNYYVVNDGSGNLSGWAWNDNYGWISFYCGNHSGCGDSNYRVYLTASGTSHSVFYNHAWNDVAGWVSFNCSDPGVCGTSDYKVVTTWVTTSTSATLESSTIDTGIADGAQINSVLWQGSQPASTAVRFQFAVSGSVDGPWSYKGSDGTSNSYYITDPGVSKPVDYTIHNNFRYFRYKVELISDTTQTASPKIDDIIINWSR